MKNLLMISAILLACWACSEDEPAKNYKPELPIPGNLPDISKASNGRVKISGLKYLEQFESTYFNDPFLPKKNYIDSALVFLDLNGPVVPWFLDKATLFHFREFPNDPILPSDIRSLRLLPSGSGAMYFTFDSKKLTFYARKSGSYFNWVDDTSHRFDVYIYKAGFGWQLFKNDLIAYDIANPNKVLWRSYDLAGNFAGNIAVAFVADPNNLTEIEFNSVELKAN